MDCLFMLAEELDRRECTLEAFRLLIIIIEEERRLSYFRHFTADIEILLKEIVRLRLKSAVDTETYIDCLETLLSLGFSASNEKRWKRSLAKAYVEIGDKAKVEQIMHTLVKERAVDTVEK